MSAVRNCGCDDISDLDTSTYDSNWHYFTRHLFTCNSLHAIDDETAKEDQLDLNTKFDNLVTKVLDDEVIDSSSDLNTMFNEWMSKVLDNEAGRTSDLKKKITESLSRQLQDGLLSYYEYVDLEYIGGVWLKVIIID